MLPLGDMLTGNSYIKQLKNYRKEAKLNKQQLEELQKTKLLKTLQFAKQNIPYYQKLDIDFSSGNPFEIVKQFPIVDKKTLNSNLQDFCDPNYTGKINTLYSSGSSGVQGQVKLSNEGLSKVRAINTLMWEDSGYKIGDRTLQLGMTTKRSAFKKIKDIFFRVDYHRAFNLTDEEVLAVLKKYKGKKNNVYFVGYASGLYAYAQVAYKHNLNISFSGIISFGDKMFAHYKELLESTFDCKVYETYGSNEALTVGYVSNDDKYYLLTNFVHVEVMDDKGNEKPNGEMGLAIVTGLENHYMPLIRYRIGDIIELSATEASNNNQKAFPLINRVIGRDTDIIKTTSGKSMIVHFFTAFMGKRDDVEQFRVVQNTTDEIDFEYIPSAKFNNQTLDFVETEIRKYVNADELKVNYVEKDFIPNSPSGKPQIIVSNIK